MNIQDLKETKDKIKNTPVFANTGVNINNIEEIFNKSIFVFTKMNINITYQNLEEGIIEGEAVSFWYGFKDDFIVRIEKLISDDIKIDIRSASRSGRSDFGKNYDRILQFISYF